MKNLFKFLAILGVFLPSLALGQNQGDDTPLGASGTKILCNANEALTNTVSANGKLNYLACTKSGGLLPGAVTSTTTTIDMTSTSSTAVVSCAGMASVSLAIIRTAETGTLNFQGSQDGTNYNTTLPAYYIDNNPATYVSNPTSGSNSNMIVGNGTNAFFTSCTGWKNIRVKVTSAGAGAALPIVLASSPAALPVILGIFPGSNPYNLGKAEDAAHASGDVGVMSLGVANETLGVFGANLDYTPIATTRAGAVFTMEHLGMYPSALLSQGLLKAEDSAVTSTDAGVAVLTQRLDQLDVGQTGGNNEYATPIVDTLSRQYVNAWGSAVTEFIQGCNTAIVTATTGDMLAADASNRFYISSWSCTNTGAAATRVILEDDDGTDFANLMLAATTGFASITFPVPVRLGAVNKGAQINVITTSSSTICCFNGFKSVY